MYLSGLACLSKFDEQVFLLKNGHAFLPCFISICVCESDGGKLRVCLYVRSIHNIYDEMPESRALKFNLLCQCSATNENIPV